MSSGNPETGAERPFLVPCRRLPNTAALRWLQRGWQDLIRTPALSLSFGMVIVVLSVLVAALAYALGRLALLAALLSGFVYIAPLIGVALYGVSRELEVGRRPSFALSLHRARRVLGQAGVFALIQLVILLIWSRSGMMVSAFVPIEPGRWETWVEFLAIGSLVGSVFAALTFASAVVSLPMLADRDVDMVTACLSSIHAVLRNPLPMGVWAAGIALLTAVGFLTFFLGLAVIMPWLAYASWHAYRDTLDPADWPALEGGAIDRPAATD